MNRPGPQVADRVSGEPSRAAPPRGRGAGSDPLIRRRTLLLGLLTLTVLAAALGYTVYGSPLLRAQHVKVSGNTVLTDNQIIHAAKVPLGGALVSVDTGAVRSRLLT